MPHRDKRVTWVELFFDLVFVVAVTQVPDLLHADHHWPGIARAVVVFIPVYWAWVGTTMHANLHDVNKPCDRLGMFTLGLCGLFMALTMPQAYGAHALPFGASYWAARLVLFALVQRSYRGIGFNPFTAGAFITGPLLLTGGLVHGPARVWLWALAAIVDLVVPYASRRASTRSRRQTWTPARRSASSWRETASWIWGRGSGSFMRSSTASAASG